METVWPMLITYMNVIYKYRILVDRPVFRPTKAIKSVLLLKLHLLQHKDKLEKSQVCFNELQSCILNTVLYVWLTISIK